MTRMLLDYAEASKESDRYTVLLIPQKDEHFRAMSEIMELEKRYWANGTAFASEPYYSLEYAQMVRDQYSKLDLFAIVAPEKCLS